MSGTLYVVATPIGNLEDITLRALRVLREADLIAAEDTRRTAGLLARHAIATRTISFHEHNTRTRIPMLLEQLHEGKRVAMVSDAGTPGLSDPGAALVQACVGQGIPVEPVPGPSAPLTLAMAAGFPMNPLGFFGFPPIRSKERKAWITVICEFFGTAMFFESPHRILGTLGQFGELLGERQIVVGRELTKVHQEFLRGTVREVLAALPHPRGEFTVIVEPASTVPGEVQAVSDEVLALEFSQMTELGQAGRRSGVAALARKYGKHARDVYAAIERAKTSGL